MAGRTVRRVSLIGLAALWWWAVLRLLLVPGAGTLEGTVAAGGWGLSLLPVHCTAKSRAAGALEKGRWRRAFTGAGPPPALAGAGGGEGPRAQPQGPPVEAEWDENGGG